MKTKNEIKHTPTPWIQDTIRPFIVTDSAGRTLVKTEIGSGFSYTVEEKANAEFIVRAVNSHEALLEALKLSVLRLKEFGEQQKKSRIDLTSDLEKAIAQAEGKGE